MKRLIALVLLAALLAGCGATNSLGFHGVVDFDEMEYVRPDPDAMERILDAVCADSARGTDLDTVVEGIWDFYDAYDDFYTNYNLAYIHYNAAMDDYYWQTEHDFCAAESASAEAMLEELFCALADSPLREELEGEDYYGADFFDAYEGESLYDETFVALLEEESALISEYYALCGGDAGDYGTETWFDAYAEPLAGILAELIGLRQEIAEYAGYDSYVDFGYEAYYYRDYTQLQVLEYCQEIRQQLVPLYRRINGSGIWDLVGGSTERQTYAYVSGAAKAMGGTVEEAFRLMDQAELYDIAISDTKSGNSFELFLTSYYQPYIFITPEGSEWDKLTFVHEFGHFVKDYVACGSYAGMDVEEFFSQGMEYLSLCYVENSAELEKLKMADCVCTYVEQAAYAEFEHRMYGLEGEALTAENLLELYEEIGLAYGFDSFQWDPRDLVTVPHFYEQPLYIISYVVSNDAALQLYQLERETPGAGLGLYEENLGTEESYFLSFAEKAGLESPFADGRVAAVRQTLEEYIP